MIWMIGKNMLVIISEQRLTERHIAAALLWSEVRAVEDASVVKAVTVVISELDAHCLYIFI